MRLAALLMARPIISWLPVLPKKPSWPPPARGHNALSEPAQTEKKGRRRGTRVVGIRFPAHHMSRTRAGLDLSSSAPTPGGGPLKPAHAMSEPDTSEACETADWQAPAPDSPSSQ